MCDRRATDALRLPVHRVSVALPLRRRPHIRRTSVVCPLCSRRPSVIRSKSTSSFFASSACRCNVVKSLSSSPSPSQWSHHRRMLVAPSSHRRCTVVAPSSHRRRIVVASSPCRRRNVVVLSLSGRQDPSSYKLETIPHMSSELR